MYWGDQSLLADTAHVSMAPLRSTEHSVLDNSNIALHLNDSVGFHVVKQNFISFKELMMLSGFKELLTFGRLVLTRVSLTSHLHAKQQLSIVNTTKVPAYFITFHLSKPFVVVFRPTYL